VGGLGPLIALTFVLTVEDKQQGALGLMISCKPMASVFAKLNLKDQTQIVLLGPPNSFKRELTALKGVEIIRDLRKVKRFSYSLAFVTTQEEVDTPWVQQSAERPRATQSYGWHTPRKVPSNISRE